VSNEYCSIALIIHNAL